jgi:hypothetical protein
VVGDEGGCDVSYDPGLRDAQVFGDRCIAGYTPGDANNTWFTIQDYQTYILGKYPTFVDDYGVFPVYNTTEVDGVACTLPISDDSTRPVEVCGGARGVLRKDEYQVVDNVTLMSDVFIRRCPRMLVNGEILEERPLFYSIKIASWISSNTTLTMIHGNTYLNGTQIHLTEPCSENRCEYIEGVWVECVPFLESETHRIRTMVDGEIEVLLTEDFFNYRILR